MAGGGLEGREPRRKGDVEERHGGEGEELVVGGGEDVGQVGPAGGLVEVRVGRRGRGARGKARRPQACCTSRGKAVR